MINGNMIETINGMDTNVLSTEKGRISQIITGAETNAKTFIKANIVTQKITK